MMVDRPPSILGIEDPDATDADIPLPIVERQPKPDFPGTAVAIRVTVRLTTIRPQ
ncbi:MAG: hypothetical protein HY725_12565 [Candidatus Rokubacteria bacterium]|nr:hypothetical protein [Candidatus Rokubacteria bacterium]